MRFVVAGLLHVGVYTVVDATNRARALKIAEARGLMQLCPRCKSARRKQEQSRWCFGEEIRGEVDDLAIYASDAKAAGAGE